jgi:hypothetical protein
MAPQFVSVPLPVALCFVWWCSEDCEGFVSAPPPSCGLLQQNPNKNATVQLGLWDPLPLPVVLMHAPITSRQS